MHNRKVIVRIKGGLGNQLFCYAAARRLAIVNSAELVIDDVTGFRRDHEYRRRCELGRFMIQARAATAFERMEPFERYRRALMIWRSRAQPFNKRTYVKQVHDEFDERLLELQVEQDLYLDGLWQSENYFKDMEDVLRRDLRIKPPQDRANRKMAKIIDSCNAVALHMRWFAPPGEESLDRKLAVNYYEKAVGYVLANLERPHFFVFSDNPHSAARHLDLPESGYTVVSHNSGDINAYADLWLMSRCQHFITANSTFSWWGAWLGANSKKLVITPSPETLSPADSWRNRGLLPNSWIKI